MDSEGTIVRTDDGVGPYHDKHALTINGFREVHLGPKASECAACREAKRLASKEKE